VNISTAIPNASAQGRIREPLAWVMVVIKTPKSTHQTA
jgi:hypothetical protein